MDEFHAVLTAKHDEGLACIRDFVRRSDNKSLLVLMQSLMAGMETEDDMQSTCAHFAMLGLLHAWLSVLNEKQETESND